MTDRAKQLSSPVAVGGDFVVALIIRLALVVRSGGFLGNYGYDSGVYYAAADGLIHGRMPYRDFVFLHPPALMLALSPAALLGRLTTDPVGFLGANLVFTVIGAVNAALIVVVAKRIGLSSAGAVVGGLFYALWIGSASAEFLGRLEPLGNFFLVLGLYALAGAAQPDGHRDRSPAVLLAVGGAAFGVAASVKIWFVVPLLVAAAWLLIERRAAKPAAMFVAGAVGAGIVINGPFLAVARGHMWSMVVTGQLGRPREAVSTASRLAQLSSLDRVSRQLGTGATVAVSICVGVVMVAVLMAAWRMRSARIVVILAIAQVATLLASPSWFGFYADFAAVPVALSVAACAAALPARIRGAGWLPTVAAALVTVAVLVTASFHATSSWGGAERLTRIAAKARCVMADAPNGLIELNTLDRDLANGCPNWVDVTGHTYLGADKRAGPRTRNQPWQRDLRAYLLSGQAVFLVRTKGDGMTAATLRVVEAHGVIGRIGPYRLYRGDGTASAARFHRAAEAIALRSSIRGVRPCQMRSGSPARVSMLSARAGHAVYAGPLQHSLFRLF